jgi:hypothetical protein
VWLGRLNSGAKMRVGKKTKKLDGNWWDLAAATSRIRRIKKVPNCSALHQQFSKKTCSPFFFLISFFFLSGNNFRRRQNCVPFFFFLNPASILG